MPSEQILPGAEHSSTNAVPGYKNYLVYCDESGVDGAEYYGFGSLWMPWERRGDFQNIITTLRAAYSFDNELKWKKIGPRNFDFCKSLVGEFFRRQWLMFHCMLIRKGYVDKNLHGDDPYDTARRKHFAKLLETKIQYFSRQSEKKAYHAIVDPIASRYSKAGEAAHKIVNSSLKLRIVTSRLESLREADSKSNPGIQLTDMLLGAVMAAWRQEVSSREKINIMAEIARHLGWQDLRADTRPEEWKFNIWYFFDPTSKRPREVETRAVNHLIPTPLYRRKRP